MPTTPISASQVRDLRERSGAPMMDCKQALTESGGDLEKAADWLRKKGMARAAKTAGRQASQGLVHAYVHFNGRLGVLLEINCETDFVAKTEDFKSFCNDVALHIASLKPTFVRREEVPESVVAKECEILAEQVDRSKPAEIQRKMVEGRLGKFYAEICLLEQPFVKDDKKTVEQLRAELVGRLGENVQIRRFVRYEIGL